MTYYNRYPNRTVCELLEEMRKLWETRNFAPMLGIIEEIQIAANAMEAGLSDQKDILQLREDKSALVREIKELEKKARELGATESRLHEVLSDGGPLS